MDEKTIHADLGYLIEYAKEIQELAKKGKLSHRVKYMVHRAHENLQSAYAASLAENHHVS